MKCKVTIEETLSHTFEVEARSIEEACGKVEKEYRNGSIVLEPGECVHRKISGYEEGTGETVLWNEL